MDNQFAKDIIKGLSSNPKQIPSKYFYDDEGSRIFQKIMALDEYYLTGAEYDLFSNQKDRILSTFQEGVEKFDLIEFGAGDGLKTKILLKHFLDNNAQFRYTPIDISTDAMDGLVKDLKTEFPKLEVNPIVDDYFNALKNLEGEAKTRKIVLFLGSNIGNFKRIEAVSFISKIRGHFNDGDLLMIGLDLKKDPRKIIAAYDDQSGITESFNMNLLTRMNNELGANFNLKDFLHYPNYDPISGEVRSYLMCNKNVDVYFSKLGKTIHFDRWELIHTEISRKYDMKGIEKLASDTDFTIKANFVEEEHCYLDTVWQA